MATTITVGGTDISDQYADFTIEVPLSPVDISPSATITTTNDISVTAGDSVTIDIDGTTVFDGEARSGGRKRAGGGRRLEAVHPAEQLFSERVDVLFDLVSGTVTDKDVLEDALNSANSGGNFTLDFAPTPNELGTEFQVENRAVKRVFRDMMDRSSNVWWVEPAGTTIHVEKEGGRGQWKDLDTQTDRVRLEEFDAGSVDSVRNDVTVIGTGGEKVEGTASDSTSISNYGRRTEPPVNVSYITTQSEADAMAQELLVPEPLAKGKLLAGQNVGDVTAPLVNQTVAVTDSGLNVDESGLVIEKQTIQQGRAELQIGEGTGVSLSNINRESKSKDDTTEPGSVYGNDRLADDSVDTEQLVDTAVIENKLADLSVALQKVQDGAIDTVKITDSAIETPKLQAGAVTAAKILADTITANEIDAGTITALEIAAGTLTANEVDTLDLDTTQLFIGTDADSGITFDTDTVGTTTVTRMLPESDGFANIGDETARYNNIYSLDIDFTAAKFSNGSTIFFDQLDGEGAMFPNTDNTGTIGRNAAAGGPEGFSEVLAHNFVTLTPEPIAGGVDLASLTGYSWDNPPEYAAQTKAKHDDDRDYKRHNPNHGVEMSHMANYLLETCKAQQERIDDLEARVAALE